MGSTKGQGRVLTTHVGSLPRPAKLSESLIAADRGEPVDAIALASAVREAVAETIRRQVGVGIDIVSDGEMSKISYATYVRHRLAGFSLADTPRAVPADLDAFPAYRDHIARLGITPSYQRPACTGPIAVRDTGPLEADLGNLRHALCGTEVEAAFMTTPSPGVIAIFQPNRHYPTDSAYLRALADAMRPEYEAVVGAGFVLQVDCPDLAMGRHIRYRDEDERSFLRHAEEQVEVLNHALSGIPPASLRMHVCWGNYEGPHTFDVPLEQILPVVLRARPAMISLEASNPRHAHEWAAWTGNRLPDDKVLIPGVIDSCTNYVEHPELVAERIIRFAHVVGRERVVAGTDCGFGTFAGFGKVHPDICWAKLGSLVAGAEIASRKLWKGGAKWRG